MVDERRKRQLVLSSIAGGVGRVAEHDQHSLYRWAEVVEPVANRDDVFGTRQSMHVTMEDDQNGLTPMVL